MSIVATNLQQPFRRSPHTQLQQQQDRIFVNNQKQLKRQRTEKKHVTKTDIQVKQLIKGATVAAAKEKVKPENIRGKPQSRDTVAKAHKELQHSYSSGREKSADKDYQDYQIYQNGNVNDFFEKNTLGTARSVADICLVNDHFILVKMSEENFSAYRIKLNESATSHKHLRASKGRSKDQKESRKLCCCLRNKRNRITKIAPIHEEPEDLSEDEEKFKSGSNYPKFLSCWQANEPKVEMYQTETKIYRSFPNTLENRSKFSKSSRSPQPAAGKPQPLDCRQASDIPTISGSLWKSSLQYKVALQQYGSLLDSQNNNDNTLNPSEKMNRARHRKRPCLESFYWLLRPFRGKYRQTEPKIHAIVYKTYFVKWTKPPDTPTRDYGVPPLRPWSVLRRCRSALF